VEWPEMPGTGYAEQVTAAETLKKTVLLC